MPVSLGDIVFGIGPDLTRLQGSIQTIQNFGTAVEAAARQTNGAAIGATAALMRQEAAAISALKKVQMFQDQVGKSAAPTNLAAGFNNLSTQGLDRFIARMSSGQLSAIQFQREMERFNATMTNSQRILSQYAQSTTAAAQNGMVASLQQMAGAATLIYGPLSGVATRFQVMASLADHFSMVTAGMVVGIAAGAYAFTKLGEAIIDVERRMQSTLQTFEAVAGSQAIAGTQIKYLGDFADKAGVKFDDLAKNYGQITAASKGTNLEGERTNKIFEGITLAAGKLGLSADDTKGSLLAIQQIITKGTVQMEELKSQLGDRMPGALKAYADSLGVTTAKFSEMVQKGQVGASTLVGFVDTLIKRYNIDENIKIDTITAAENRLYNARTRMVDSLDKVIGLSSAYTNVLNYLAGAINGTSQKASDLVKTTLQVGAGLIAAFGSQLVLSGLAALTTGVINFGAALFSVNTVMAAAAGFNSFIKLIAMAGIAVASFYGSKAMIEEIMGSTKESFLNANPPVEKYIESMLKLQDASNSVRKPTLQYIDDQIAKLEQLKTKQIEIAEASKSGLGKLELAEGLGATAAQLDALAEKEGLTKLWKDAQKASKDIDATNKALEQLQGILVQQTVVEAANRDDPVKALNEKQLLTLKGAQDTIRETKAMFDALSKSGSEKTWADTQNEINKLVENFRDGLTKAQFPLELITKLTLEFGAAMKSLKEGSAIQDTAYKVLDAVRKGTEVTADMEDRLKNVYKSDQAKELANAQLDVNKNVRDYRRELENAGTDEALITVKVNERRKAMEALKKAEINHSYAQETTRQTVAMKNANDTVKELDKTYNNLYLAPAAKEWADLQNANSKAIENFRDTLTKTELPAAKVTELTNNYATSLKRVKEAELTLSHQTSYFKAVEGVFSRGLDTGLNNFVNSIMEGKSAFESLRDTFKAVAADIIKTMMTLAVLNPLKNSLFGTNYNTLGGNAGVGGLLGGLFTPSSPEAKALAGGTAPMAMGGIVGPGGSRPLKRYASGGVARGSQWAEFGEGSTPEAYVPLPDGRSIPVSMRGGGGPVEVHVHEAPGVKASVQSSNGKNGPRVDIQIRNMVRDIMQSDISNGGPISQAHERQYGLNRARGLSA